MAKSLRDPVFGELVFDVFWCGHFRSVRLGGSVGLMIDTSEAEWLPNPGHLPSDAQRACMTEFLAQEEALLQRVEHAVYTHYNRVKDAYRECRSGNTMEDVPELASPSEIWRLLEKPRLLIPPQEEGGTSLKFGWNCSWDPEHGISVSIENGEVVDIE